ncbi:MAG: 4-alpha-glucanotransferase [Phycisphaerae bacterium]|nr:4-alpha-glucanotransferase [Phycisphaerae bacterium]
MFRKRSSGVLLHISSLPSAFGIGDLGPQAYQFVDFLKQADQTYWQMLPLNCTTAQAGYSPYNCYSAFAGNPLLISPDQLYAKGLLDKQDVRGLPSFPAYKVSFARVETLKNRLLNRAFERFFGQGIPDAYQDFVTRHKEWLDDFVLFTALKHRIGARRMWTEWPKPLRDRDKNVLKEIRKELGLELERYRFLQYMFWRQFTELRDYCREQDILLVGDVPLYVAQDSADVWAHHKLFKLNADKRPKFKAGVPPDYFSKTGQLWGNPVYNWDAMAKQGYAWFVDRIAHNMSLFDTVRIDHFRGFAAYWEIPGSHKTAMHGQWQPGPGQAFFETLFEKLPFVQIFAEDLGHITADVRELMREFDFAGMKVLHFGFDGKPSQNSHCPHNHEENYIVYTGTHDNNTSRGWFEHNATEHQKTRLCEYLGYKVTSRTVAWQLIRLAMTSVAKVAMTPMQDILNLGQEARMNFPSKARGNWQWRMGPKDMASKHAARLKALTELTGRV